LGGDELFGGYPSFRRLSRLSPAARRWGAAPAAMRRAAAGLVRAAGGGRVATEKAAAALESDGSLAQLWPVTRQLFPARQRASLVGDRDAASAGQPDAYASLLASSFAEAANAGLWARISHAETRGYMHDVLLRDADQMSMAHGLEVRVPLLDHRLASYVVSLPDAVKAEGRAAKPLLVAALPRPLPAGLAERAKRGFSLPWDAWMRGPLRAYCEAHLGEQGLDGRGLLQPGAASRLWSGFLQGSRGVTWSRVWALVALNAWLDRQAVDTR
jgi:asparagine synthase (glutamine-hydrolysing)